MVNNCVFSLLLLHILYWRNSREKTCWVKSGIRRRYELGTCSTLTKQLKIEDDQQFRNFICMNAVQVQYLIELLGPEIVCFRSASEDKNMVKYIWNLHYYLMEHTLCKIIAPDPLNYVLFRWISLQSNFSVISSNILFFFSRFLYSLFLLSHRI